MNTWQCAVYKDIPALHENKYVLLHYTGVHWIWVMIMECNTYLLEANVHRTVYSVWVWVLYIYIILVVS